MENLSCSHLRQCGAFIIMKSLFEVSDIIEGGKNVSLVESYFPHKEKWGREGWGGGG